MNLTLTTKRAITIGVLAASTMAMSGHSAVARVHPSPTISSRPVAEGAAAVTTDRSALMAHAAGSDRHLENLSAEIAKRAETYLPLYRRFGTRCWTNPVFSVAMCAV